MRTSGRGGEVQKTLPLQFQMTAPLPQFRRSKLRGMCVRPTLAGWPKLGVTGSCPRRLREAALVRRRRHKFAWQ